MFPDQFSEEGEDGKLGSSSRKLPKSGEMFGRQYTSTERVFATDRIPTQTVQNRVRSILFNQSQLLYRSGQSHQTLLTKTVNN